MQLRIVQARPCMLKSIPTFEEHEVVTVPQTSASVVAESATSTKENKRGRTPKLLRKNALSETQIQQQIQKKSIEG